jgi:lipopolysaccharide/colanic/teichoic acid biosynthesis glycosyltransferase
MEEAQLTAPGFGQSSRIEGRAVFIPEIKEPFLKRPFDMGLAGLGLLFSAPLWAIASLAIKLEDGGPVFFRQERWGRGKRPIRVYKFRTMVPNAKPDGVTVQATADDPRITLVGKILRATAFDEIPQLLNIWNGEMSFVGPRALPMNERQRREHSEEIPDAQIPGFEECLRVKPGLTGIAQSWPQRDIPRRHKFKYDLLYLKKQSLWFHLKLIVLSFWITIRGKWEARGETF